MPASEFHRLDQVRGEHVVLVGYGKSACHIAVEIAKAAASTIVVARQLIWKMPRKIKGVVNYKYLMLTRMGEGLFKYHRVSGVEKVLNARNSALADTMLGSVGTVTAGQLGLDRLGLRPGGAFKDIARSTVSLATEGFFEGVAGGRIAVHRDTEIIRFVEKDGQPCAELGNGDLVRADVVIAVTGWTQELPFLPDEVVERLVDERGDFLLHPLFQAGPGYAALGADLHRLGLVYCNTDGPVSASVSDRGVVVAHRDPAMTAASFEHAEDAAACTAMLAELGARAGTAFGVLDSELSGRELVRLGTGALRSLGRDGTVDRVRDTLQSGRGLVRERFRGWEVDQLWSPWLLHAGLSPDHASGGMKFAVLAVTMHEVGLPVVSGGAELRVRVRGPPGGAWRRRVARCARRAHRGVRWSGDRGPGGR